MSGNKELQTQQGKPILLQLGKGAGWFEKVIQIQAEANQVIAVTSHGRVFVGQCREAAGNQRLELVEKGLERARVIKIASGERHSLALTSEGRVFGWGSNKYGQLAQEFEQGLERPIPVEMTAVYTIPSPSLDEQVERRRTSSKSTSSRITDIFAAGNTSYFIAESNTSTDILACGQGQWCQLGVGAVCCALQMFLIMRS